MDFEKLEAKTVVSFAPRFKQLTDNELLFIKYVLQDPPGFNSMNFTPSDFTKMKKVMKEQPVKKNVSEIQQEYFSKVIAAIEEGKGELPLHQIFSALKDDSAESKSKLIFGEVKCSTEPVLEAKDIQFLDDLMEKWEGSDQFAYNGFNPVAGRQAVLEIVKALDAKDAKRVGSRHLINLVSVVCMRGTNAKMDKRMSMAGVELIKVAMVDLKISRDTGKNMGQAFINLSRLASCFPDAVSKFYLNPANKIHLKCPTIALPIRYTHPSAACMIPKSKPSMFKIWCKWAKSFSTLIGAKDKKQKKFWKIIYGSSMFDETQRNSYYEAAMREQIVRIQSSASSIDDNMFSAFILASQDKEEKMKDYLTIVYKTSSGQVHHKSIEEDLEMSESSESSDSESEPEENAVTLKRDKGAKKSKVAKKNRRSSSKKEVSEGE